MSELTKKDKPKISLCTKTETLNYLIIHSLQGKLHREQGCFRVYGLGDDIIQSTLLQYRSKEVELTLGSYFAYEYNIHLQRGGSQVDMHPLFKMHVKRIQKCQKILHKIYLNTLCVHKVLPHKTDILCGSCKKRKQLVLT